MKKAFILSFLVVSLLLSPLLPLVVSNASYLQALKFQTLVALYLFLLIFFSAIFYFFRTLSTRFLIFLLLSSSIHLILAMSGVLFEFTQRELLLLISMWPFVIGTASWILGTRLSPSKLSSLTFIVVFTLLGSDIYYLGRIYFLKSEERYASSRPNRDPKVKLPRIIHFVLDEFSSSSEFNPYVHSPDSFLFKINRGVFFSKAYSTALSTRESFDQMFSGQLKDASYSKETTFFQALLNKGYEVNLYLADGVIPCNRFPSTQCRDTLWATSNVLFKESLWESIVFQLKLLAQLSPLNKLYSKVQEAASLSLKTADAPRYTKSISLTLFEKAQEDMLKASDSSYFLIHLMLPHPPNVHDEECRVVGDLSLMATNPDSYQLELEKGYMRQVHCANKLLLSFLKLLHEKELLDSTVIVVQGDHGARFRKPKGVALCSKEMNEYRKRAAHSFLWYKPLESKKRLLTLNHDVNLIDMTQSLAEDLELNWKAENAVHLMSDSQRINMGFPVDGVKCSD